VIQWWINDNILSNVSIGPNIFGFVRGRSAVDNARFHKGAKHLLNVDIEHFFPSIRRESVYAIFVDIGYSPGVAAQLSNICTLDNALPQGAPTSPTIANLIFRDVDKKIGDLADENELLYSRYADDLTFSSLEYIDGSFIKKLSEILYSARFRLKQTKTRFSSHGSRMEITGLTVNDYVHPSREWRRKARAMLHKYANSPQLSDLEVDRINGIKGIANMVDNSPSMLSIKRQLERLSELRFKNPNR
jgi:retron-type reverse transcriptase